MTITVSTFLVGIPGLVRATEEDIREEFGTILLRPRCQQGGIPPGAEGV